MGTRKPEPLSLLTDYDSNSAYHIAYHRLYANIRFHWDTERYPQYALLLVSPAIYTGQSAAANLAIAAAQNNTPTVLIDADLHHPGLLERFGSNQQTGLSDLLVHSASRLALSKTFLPDLSILGAGTALPPSQRSTLLLSTRLNDILRDLRQHLATTEKRPALLIFHAPPLDEGIDASQLSALVDQTFLLIYRGRTTRTQLTTAQEQLERAQARLAGTIMLDI